MVTRPDSKKARMKRHARVRGKINGTASCPRLCVYRSLANIGAQIIDDTKGVTLVSASSYEKDFGYGGNKEAAKKIGVLITGFEKPREFPPHHVFHTFFAFECTKNALFSNSLQLSIAQYRKG